MMNTEKVDDRDAQKEECGAKEQCTDMILVNEASKRKNRARDDASSLHELSKQTLMAPELLQSWC